MKRYKFLLIFFLMMLPGLRAAADKYEDYVERYAEMAVAEMHRSGVPASITLSQGLLESGAGLSSLATEGNNHFGIKCHNEWQGETMLRDDDEQGECFRVYGSAAESFADHSRFLQRRRYSSLFELDPTDYKGWAEGLKRCGYATDPHYAPKLIAVIERYGLYRYDHEPGEMAELDTEYIMQTLSSTHVINKADGRYFIIAFPGDTYTSLSAELGIDAKVLREVNEGKEIQDWTEVYLQ